MEPCPTGDTVTSIDTRHNLLIDTAGGWSIRVEGDCTLHHPGGSVAVVDDRFSDLAPLLTAWVGRTLDGLEHDAGGGLAVRCGPYRLVVPPSVEFEAWGIAGPAQQKIVSLPGGEIARWDAV